MTERDERAARPGPVGARVRRPNPGAGTRPSAPGSRADARPTGPDGPAERPAVAAIGGGHGLAVALRAIRCYAQTITAVVNVADDGGSSGRLRREYGIPPPGDLRRALGALAAGEPAWCDAFEHRFVHGELAGHPLGNLVLLGLTETLGGDFCAALEEAGRLLETVGRVLPATTEPVELRADVDNEVVEGQVAVMKARGRIRHVELVPPDPPAPADAMRAIGQADQIVLAPGSLFSSVLPVLCVPGIAQAVEDAPGEVVQVANLAPQIPETEGLDGPDHLRAVLEHGGRVDRFLYDPKGGLAVDEAVVRSLDAEPVAAGVARPNRRAHDPARLGESLRGLL